MMFLRIDFVVEKDNLVVGIDLVYYRNSNIEAAF